MKITESSIKREGVIFDLPKHKHQITFGDMSENIWVAIDRENKVMYLLNHALTNMVWSYQYTHLIYYLIEVKQ